MLKFSPFLIACSLAAFGCDSKDIAATTTPVATVVETPKTSPPGPTTPVKTETPAGDEDKYTTIKGRIVWDAGKGAAPTRTAIKPTKDEEVCAKDKDFNTEDWIINPKTGGIKNVVIWLAPEPDAATAAALKAGTKKDVPSFAKKDIHPALAKPAKPSVEIDQPCCRFIPHIVLAQEGQDMVIKNSASVPHNAKWTSRNNGEINPLLPSGAEHVVKDLKAEKFPIEVACSIHPWMKAYVRVFDHPYFAVTDEDGNFEIKNAPVLGGKLRVFVWQETAGFSGGKEGRFGETLEVKPGKTDLRDVKFNAGK